MMLILVETGCALALAATVVAATNAALFAMNDRRDVVFLISSTFVIFVSARHQLGEHSAMTGDDRTPLAGSKQGTYETSGRVMRNSFS